MTSTHRFATKARTWLLIAGLTELRTLDVRTGHFSRWRSEGGVA